MGSVAVAKPVVKGSGGVESSVRLDWPSESLPSYVPGELENGPKMVILQQLIHRTVQLGEKILIFR